MKNPRYLLQVATLSDPKEVALPRGLIRQLLEMIETPSNSPHEGHPAIIEYVREQIGDNERTAHMAYLVPFLHYDGERRNELDPGIRMEAVRLCDGYGQTDNPDLLGDWIHVRDSSVEALAEARKYIEAALAFRV